MKRGLGSYMPSNTVTFEFFSLDAPNAVLFFFFLLLFPVSGCGQKIDFLNAHTTMSNSQDINCN